VGRQLRSGEPGLQQFLHPGKTEQLPLFVHGFHNAVGSHHQTIIFLQLKMGDTELSVLDYPQRQGSLQLDWLTVEIRRQMGNGGNGGQPESVSEIDGAAPKKALCPELKLLMMIV